jgi:hypothetical protein
MEMDANAKGVEVLERAAGYDSRTAFYVIARKLIWQVGGPVAVGHESGACAELRDLMKRYPAYPVGLPAACL